MKALDTSLVHRLFYPAVPALLCASAGKKATAMPVVSYLSISSEPALVGIACASGSFTARLAASAGEFTLCLLDESMVGAMAYLAEHSGRAVDDKIAAAGLKHAPGRKVRAPVISGSVAVLECALHSRRKMGDHHLLVGRVRVAYTSADFRDYWRFRSYRPILFRGWRGALRTYGRRGA